ncbi:MULTISPECIES: siderophore-interacting protein [unclassified Arthrobacter]|uniref:siderophore-interacting protein n=1 Tax=unclassified Arthrobacter TaxID=235627 RepID=UPI0014908FF2|nr:siderophore-interacting protein [Arthrobacter sp. AET 35A]MBE0009360.1 siderophore-interacting protein [Arthrobacter sp. AET 35A]NOJ63195.1 siderophore-interacting protein [Arthrobacter sp. 147(2020)]
MSVAPVRKPKPQSILTVQRTEWLSPAMVRVVAGGDGFASFGRNDFTDRYVKIHFAKPELGLVPPYDHQALRETLDPADLPVTRTYTVRWVDYAAQELAIDFVVHGDEGLAGPWAASAQPGDTLVVAGPGGGYSPNPEADWYLYAADETALPAVAAALESLPADAVGMAFLEVEDEPDRLDLTAPSGVELVWLYRRGATAGTLLAAALQQASWRDGRVHVFAHGERESMKQLRDVFFVKHGLERSQVSLSGYWALGRTEDRFQAEKKEPVGKILD